MFQALYTIIVFKKLVNKLFLESFYFEYERHSCFKEAITLPEITTERYVKTMLNVHVVYQIWS